MATFDQGSSLGTAAASAKVANAAALTSRSKRRAMLSPSLDLDMRQRSQTVPLEVHSKSRHII